MRTLCAAWCQPSGGKYGDSASSPVWPNGEWPTSWPSAIASASGSLRLSAAGQRARDLGDLHRVRQARDEVVALRVEEDLGLVLQPPERLGVDDPVPVALERGAELVRLLGPLPPTARRRPGGGRAQPLLIRLARLPVAATKSALGADLLHRPMMPWGFIRSGR